MPRPAKFDREQVVAQVTDLFRHHGFAGTSMDAIDAATGLNRGSVYHAFGDKRGLYLEALQHYGSEQFGAAAELVLAGNCAQHAIRTLFMSAAEALVRDGGQRGCFVCNASIEMAPVDAQVAQLVRKYLSILGKAFVGALTRQHGSGELAATSPQAAQEIADHLVASYMGLQMLGKAGCPADQLKRVARSSVELLAQRQSTRTRTDQ